MFYKILYAFVMPPGGIISLLILLNIYLYWKKISGKIFLTGIIVLFYLLSIQFTAFYLIKPLENMYTNYSVEELQMQNHDVIIMLGGGAINNITDIDGDGQVSGYVANRMIKLCVFLNNLIYR